MGHRPFSKPVFLKLHRTGNFQAGSAWEAHEYLDLHWSAPHTAHYRRAKVLCQSAIDGIVDAEVARRAVIDAADRAGLLASKWEVDSAGTNTSFMAVRDTWGFADQRSADDVEVTDSDLIGYNRAAEIVDDPALSPSRKKALLAYWGSDLHAVAGAPALRCAGGVTVTIDSLFKAMARLDDEIDHAAMPSEPADSSRNW